MENEWTWPIGPIYGSCIFSEWWFPEQTLTRGQWENQWKSWLLYALIGSINAELCQGTKSNNKNFRFPRQWISHQGKTNLFSKSRIMMGNLYGKIMGILYYRNPSTSHREPLRMGQSPKSMFLFIFLIIRDYVLYFFSGKPCLLTGEQCSVTSINQIVGWVTIWGHGLKLPCGFRGIRHGVMV